MFVFSQRLASILNEKKLTQQEVADFVGVRRQAVARWLNGTSEPDREKVQQLAKLVDMPPAYIMFGEDGAFDADAIDNQTLSIPVWNGIENMNGIEGVKELRVHKDWILQKVANADLQNLFVINVTGDNMAPFADEGDFVIIDASKTELLGDGVFAIKASGQLFIKRVQRQINGSILLINDNKQYAITEISVDEHPMISIVGKVVLVCRTH